MPEKDFQKTAEDYTKGLGFSGAPLIMILFFPGNPNEYHMRLPFPFFATQQFKGFHEGYKNQ